MFSGFRVLGFRTLALVLRFRARTLNPLPESKGESMCSGIPVIMYLEQPKPGSL